MESDIVLYLKILQEIKIQEKLDMTKKDFIVCQQPSKDIFRLIAQNQVMERSSLTK